MRGKSKKTTWSVFEGHRLRLTGFRSRQFGMIYANQNALLQQAPADAFLEFLGTEVDGRLRLGHWILEARGTYQVPFANGDETLVDFFQDRQPGIYGRGRLFWEGHDTRIARAIRTGFEYHYFTDFNIPLFDAPSQAFYPQSIYQQAGYHRLDFFFSAQIKRAQVYGRVYNTLEGVQAPGYYTTLFYPMWDRAFMIGLNWSFYD